MIQGLVLITRCPDILCLQQAYSFPVSLGFRRLETGGLPKTREENGGAGRKKKRKKRKKERKAAVAVTTTIFFLFCVKKNPYILRDHFEEDRCRLLWKESLIISRATDATC